MSDVAAVVRQFDSAWQRADLDTLMSLVSEDCVYDASVGPGPGRQFIGKEAVRGGFAQMLAYDQCAEGGGELVMVDHTHALMLWTVKHRGSNQSVVGVRGCDVFEVRDGLIRRKDAFRKSLD
jgi:hypothetical protein